jgi:beta-lactamase superfamily II metal-dependent hydrolase
MGKKVRIKKNAKTAKARIAKKTTTKRRIETRPSPGSTAPAGNGSRPRARVRIYRQGLGDCILVRLPKDDGPDFSLLIDCGVAVATTDAVGTIKNVLADVGKTTNNKLDVLAVTHEHWDHVSGFQQAQDEFGKLSFGEVWLAWTEDGKDELAQKLKKDHADAFAAISRGAAVRAMSGDPGGASDLLLIAGMLGAAGEKTHVALDIAKAKAGADGPRYCLPTNLPIDIEGTGACIYVLGPPHEEKAIRHFNPSKRNPETYELALDGSGLLAAGVFAALGLSKDVRPFTDSVSIPMEAARAMSFFQYKYWGTPGDASEWRRIDDDWLGSTDEFALMLQSATNNTSLVLAIELSDGDVLLFAGDAQVGNWQSWQELNWTLDDGRKVTGPDLLSRTVFYKVGHHGSHNATLRQQGLEQMKKLKTAVIPVDEIVAKKMRWGAMPLTSLVAALDEQTAGRTLRTDRDAPAGVEGLTADQLYFEFAI